MLSNFRVLCIMSSIFVCFLLPSCSAERNADRSIPSKALQPLESIDSTIKGDSIVKNTDSSTSESGQVTQTSTNSNQDTDNQNSDVPIADVPANDASRVIGYVVPFWEDGISSISFSRMGAPACSPGYSIKPADISLIEGYEYDVVNKKFTFLLFCGGNRTIFLNAEQSNHINDLLNSVIINRIIPGHCDQPVSMTGNHSICLTTFSGKKQYQQIFPDPKVPQCGKDHFESKLQELFYFLLSVKDSDIVVSQEKIWSTCK